MCVLEDPSLTRPNPITWLSGWLAGWVVCLAGKLGGWLSWLGCLSGKLAGSLLAGLAGLVGLFPWLVGPVGWVELSLVQVELEDCEQTLILSS